MTPHVAVDGRLSKLGVRRGSSIDGRTLRHPGYTASQRVRKRIEEVFGWIKTSAGLRQTNIAVASELAGGSILQPRPTT